MAEVAVVGDGRRIGDCGCPTTRRFLHLAPDRHWPSLCQLHTCARLLTRGSWLIGSGGSSGCG